MDFSLRTSAGVIRSAHCAGIMENWQEGAEKWLFVSPHDDDACIGGGLLIQKALQEKVSVSLVVVTDGANGYCDLDQKDTICRIRRDETASAYALLGVKDVHCLDYPDGGLALHAGRHPSSDGPDVRQGFSGLQNSFTACLRRFRPTRVFVLSDSDYHPDHKTVHRELLISLFHAAGAIWPELGPSTEIPFLYEMAAYCNFAKSPAIELEASPDEFNRKLAAVGVWRSQKQISLLLDTLRENGPFEYFTVHGFGLYNPAEYRELFHE
ncbi:MAG: PIG-L family deacetylase [Spirochaetales bacterium]|nr:PIG-L family deacetylase [Spirochaetales bacterium]